MIPVRDPIRRDSPLRRFTRLWVNIAMLVCVLAGMSAMALVVAAGLGWGP